MTTQKIQPQHTDDTRLTILELSINNINSTLVRFEKRFDQIDNKFDKVDEKLETILKESNADFRWLVKFIISASVGLGALMAHGFHWF
jgi:uncharacterized protein YpuA (DUF1002 family)